MKFKAFQIFCLMVMVAFSIFLCGNAFAADEDPEGPGDEETQESAFQNPTQAQKAINLAEAHAKKPDPELDAALDKVKEAEQNLENAKDEGDEDDIKNAEDDLADAQKEADEKMAQNAGVTAEDIGQMRQDGMGWGEIAHDLGLHPSVLGNRHAKAYKEKEAKALGPGGKVSDKEIKDATARNFKSGFSKGHGANADKANKSDNGNGKANGNSNTKDSDSNKGGGSNKGGNGKGGGKK